MPGNKHCLAVVKGNPCPGYRHGLSSYCYPHDPSVTPEQRRANAAKGGRAGRGKRRIQLRNSNNALRCAGLMLNGILNRMDEEPDIRLQLRLTRALTFLIRAIVPILEKPKPSPPAWHA